MFPLAVIVTSVPPSTAIAEPACAASVTVTVPAAPVVAPIVVFVPVSATVTLTFFPPSTETAPVVIPETFTSVVAAASKVAEVVALVTFKVSTPVYVVVSNVTVEPLFKLIVSMLEIFAVTVAIAPSVSTFKVSFPAPPSNSSLEFNVGK